MLANQKIQQFEWLISKTASLSVYKHELLTLVDLGEWRNCIVQAWRPNGPLMRAVTVGNGSEKCSHKHLKSAWCCFFLLLYSRGSKISKLFALSKSEHISSFDLLTAS